MPLELPSCHCEYSWSQRLPVPVALVAVLNLPLCCRLSLSFGQDSRHQKLGLLLTQSSTGLGHLIVTELTHRGCETEPEVTDDLLCLLLNTLVRLLTAHCLPQMSVSGSASVARVEGIDSRAVPWERWGFQVSPARQRILARVRDLRALTLPSRTRCFPTCLELGALQWIAL